MPSIIKHKDRIAALRGLMKREGLDAYIIPSFDPHQSEYVHDYWKAIQWCCNFSGSAGVLIITLEKAILWTDSRYYTQARQELKNTEVVLYTEITDIKTNYRDWLATNLEENSVIGLNGIQFSINQINRFQKKFNPFRIELDPTQDLIQEIWNDRPEFNQKPTFDVPVEYVGKSRKRKLREVREEMDKHKVGAHFLSSLDDIAWVLNLRGNDIEFNPVFFAYLWMNKEEVILFIDKEKVSEKLESQLLEDRIKLAHYDELEKFISFLPKGIHIWIDPDTLNYKFFNLLEKQEAIFYKARTAAYHQKGQKNEVEIKQLRQAMIKDGIALCKLYIWLERMLDNAMVTEFEIARQLNRFRQAQGNYIGESFPAIVGYQSNGAIVHYRPRANSSKPVKPEGVLLIDSGGQYWEGTTDITRTTFLGGACSDSLKKHYTLVLKGNIALARAIFPEGTTGGQLDILARQYLWQECLNYGHGTGHGVGFFLNVHEGPQGISPAIHGERAQASFKTGMLTSNEPGLYLEKQYGIRIENLLLCQEHRKGKYDQKNYYRFETMTLYPFDNQLILSTLLSKEEKDWINNYHQMVFEQLRKGLTPEEQEWLAQKCEPII